MHNTHDINTQNKLEKTKQLLMSLGWGLCGNRLTLSLSTYPNGKESSHRTYFCITIPVLRHTLCAKCWDSRAFERKEYLGFSFLNATWLTPTDLQRLCAGVHYFTCTSNISDDKNVLWQYCAGSDSNAEKIMMEMRIKNTCKSAGCRLQCIKNHLKVPTVGKWRAAHSQSQSYSWNLQCYIRSTSFCYRCKH